MTKKKFSFLIPGAVLAMIAAMALLLLLNDPANAGKSQATKADDVTGWINGQGAFDKSAGLFVPSLKTQNAVLLVAGSSLEENGIKTDGGGTIQTANSVEVKATDLKPSSSVWSMPKTSAKNGQ